MAQRDEESADGRWAVPEVRVGGGWAVGESARADGGEDCGAGADVTDEKYSDLNL